MVKIRVPATSANIGVGFDCLGIALDLYAYFTFEEIEGFSITGCDECFSNQDNLVYTSFLKALDYLKKEVKGVSIHIESHVPLARGLGSSATCVVGGVVGAYALSNTPLDKDAILRICSEIEGHPDNVAPAIFGGLRASFQDNGEVISVSYPVDERFHFLALIPDFETKTSEARKVLPEVLPFATAVRNSAKLSIVLKGFDMYETNILANVMNDQIHEPYRKVLIHEYEKVKKICQEIESVCFYISGSGSTLMNVMREKSNVNEIQKGLNQLQHNWKCLLLALNKEGVSIC